MERGEDDDERREASIASAASSMSNFKLKSGLTPSQLSKFQELHRRRLQIKARSKIKKKPKGLVDSVGKSCGNDINGKECTDGNPSKSISNTSFPSPENSLGHTSSLEQGRGAANKASKERQKLHWGLDAKERWERKSNM
ncbi:uncharacterized protein LOC111408986 [Olea europaea var. sylvestris]|uniref:uncharacterized protein LOC111408986 n=1 Tax=Olea europaea var. sylvestris TaxID=158386 RepID=UPI000C1D5472|nr:uncharacterized protein LOC111408986 [Olea europaea var. sylvestris]